MKIVEARDGFIKIETEQSVKISSFVEVKGIEKRYIAQVVKVKNNSIANTIYAKLLFVYDGSLNKYDKTLPSTASEVVPFDFSIINNSFNITSPIVAGKFIQDGSDVIIDKDEFLKSTLISVDTPEVNNIIVSNLAKQLKQLGKVLVIDMFGIINGDKFVAGRDFKLPLNKASLEFLYEDCLKDATSDSKEMIKDIFKDLSNYSDEVEFLPFNVLKTIVDDMVEKSHIFKLLVLKNKLAMYERLGYFASDKKEADNISNILKNDYVVIDLSKVDPIFQNRYLSVIYAELGKLNLKTNVFVEASNAINKKNIKEILYSENDTKSIFITHSKFKYLSELKKLFKNYIIESTFANKELFKVYTFFLSVMDSKSYLIVGENSNYIPLISKVEKYDVEVNSNVTDLSAKEVINSDYDNEITDGSEEEFCDDTSLTAVPIESVEEESEEVQIIDESDENDLLTDDEKNIPLEAENDESDNEYHTKIDKTMDSDNEGSTGIIEITDNNTVDISVSDDEIIISNDNIEEEFTNIEGNITEEVLQTETVEQTEEILIPSNLEEDYTETDELNIYEEESAVENIIEQEQSEMPDVMSLEADDSDEIVELDVSDLGDDDIIIDISDEDSEIPEQISRRELSPEELDKEITEDVDKVFTTIKDDSISDSDLDFIDELNDCDSLQENGEDENTMFNSDDMEMLDELTSDDDNDSFLEPLEEVSDAKNTEDDEHEVLQKRDTSTPIVPVYDAEIPDEDKIVSDHVEQGDNVVHAKYGTGVVEKVIKYGNKTLHSINFDNVGRRLLDLEITEVKKA